MPVLRNEFEIVMRCWDRLKLWIIFERVVVLIGLCLLIVLAPLHLMDTRERHRQNMDHRERLAGDLSAFLSNGLSALILTSDEVARTWGSEEVEYLVTDQAELVAFQRAAGWIDFETIPAKSMSLWEGQIRLQNDSGEQRYLAVVTIHRPDDLFLSTSFPQGRETGGYRSDPLNEVRVPGFGKWIMQLAPEGCLSSIRHGCRSRELDINFMAAN